MTTPDNSDYVPHGSEPDSPVHSEAEQSHLPAVAELVSQPSPVVATPPAAWLEEPDGGEGVKISGFFHSLRRRWLLASSLGLLLACVAAALVWLFVPINYEAQAWLRIGRDDSKLMDKDRIRSSDRTYEVYKQTQKDLLTSLFVVSHVTRDSEVSQIPMVRREENPIEWLADELQATTSSETELIQISLKGPNPGDPVTIVDKLLEAYMREVVDKERTDQAKTLEQLNQSYNRKSRELQDKERDFKELAEESIAVDTDTATSRLAQQMMMMDLRELAQQRDNVRMRLGEASRQLAMARESIKAGRARPSEFAIEDMLEQDPDYFLQKEDVDELRKHFRYLVNVVAPNSSSLARIQQKMVAANRELERVKKEKTPRIVERIQRLQGVDTNAAAGLLNPIRAEIAHLQQELGALNKIYTERRDEFKNLTQVSVEVLTRLNEIGNLKEFLKKLSEELESVRVNLNRPARIQILQKAFVPKRSGDWLMKLVYMAGAWSVTFALTVTGVGIWDYQGKRVNSTKDVDGAASGLRVVGSLPLLSQTAGGLWPFSRIDQSELEVVLNFSVDSIRASLLYNQSKERIKVVMIASAQGQEGRSTVASQLAVSLARSGRRTILLDADIRNPQQHFVFGTGGDLGFCEVLRKELTIDQALQTTAVEHLWVMPAGRFDMASMQAMSSETTAEFFSQLRNNYDFVVIDVGPVLTSADSLLLGQHADTTLVSIRRDVSQVPKIHAACDRLRSVGIHIMGAVVNGTGTEIRRDELKLASAQAALPDPASEEVTAT